VNTIDSYRFGEIVISGKKYSSDVIIFPDRVKGNWRRSKGHELSLEDIAGALAESPEVLIVGTGAMGVMTVPSEVQQEVEAWGIRLIAVPTGEAAETYNQLSSSQKVVAALHLTC